MKYKRKKIVEVEAYFVDEPRAIHYKNPCIPLWARNATAAGYSAAKTQSSLAVKTVNGWIEVEFPSWLIREGTSEHCAYPVSVEYFEENFEEVK